jgi:hypothetical protein
VDAQKSRRLGSRSSDAVDAAKSSISRSPSTILKLTLENTRFNGSPPRACFYLALLALLAQASLQYFFFLSKVVYGFLHTGHFFSRQIPRRL